MYFDISHAFRTTQVVGDKLCMAHSASMAMGTTVDDFLKFLKDISVQYKNIRTEPGFGLIELKLYCLRFDKDVLVQDGDPAKWEGPGVVVVHSEHYKNVLHAVYMDKDGLIHDPNPDTIDNRNILSYKMIKFYKIVDLDEDCTCR